MNNLILEIDNAGHTIYAYNSDNDNDNENEKTKIVVSNIKGKGLGLIVSKKSYDNNNNDNIFSNTALAVQPIGKYSNRICHQCYNVIKKKAIVDNNYNAINYCSHKCLEESHHYLESIGSIIMKLLNDTSVYKDSKILIVKLLYQSNIVIIEHIMRLTINSNDINSIINEANKLMDIIIQDGSKEFINQITKNDDIVNIIAKLMLIIQYNAQALPVISLPMTSLLTLLPTFCRLNHSCSPNSSLYYELKDNKVMVYLNPLYTIDIDEEITISYLANPMMSLNDRNDYLKKSFNFHCQCHRCTEEVSWLSLSSLSSFDISNINNENIGNLYSLLMNIEREYETKNYTKPIDIYDIYNNCMILLQKVLEDIDTNKNNKIKCIAIKTIASISILWKLAGCSLCFQRINLLFKSAVIAQSLLQDYNLDKTLIKEFINISKLHTREILLVLPKLGEKNEQLQSKVIELDLFLNKYI
jgi:hypothetical protein